MLSEMIKETSRFLVEKDVNPRVTRLENKLDRQLRKLMVGAIRALELELAKQGSTIASTIQPLKIIEGAMAAEISEEILEFLGASTSVSELIQASVFAASQATMSRVIGNVSTILASGAEQGLGVKILAEQLRPALDGMKTFEVRRIARTEIKKAVGLATQAEQVQAGVQYKKWLSSGDSRVRDTHTHAGVAGEITRIDGVFSNGLRYPGDSSGAQSEFINCRCTTVPFIMPENKAAPAGMSVVRESDLVQIQKG